MSAAACSAGGHRVLVASDALGFYRRLPRRLDDRRASTPDVIVIVLRAVDPIIDSLCRRYALRWGIPLVAVTGHAQDGEERAVRMHARALRSSDPRELLRILAEVAAQATWASASPGEVEARRA